MRWSVEILDAVVESEIEHLPADIRARFARITELITNFGLENLRELYVKHREGKIGEMRMKGRDDIARAPYVTATGKRVIVLRVFTKKTDKTPRREIEIASERSLSVK